MFTTILKFSPVEKGARMPLLTHVIVVIADEAHHSQYDLIDGFARHCPALHNRIGKSEAIASRNTHRRQEFRLNQQVFIAGDLMWNAEVVDYK